MVISEPNQFDDEFLTMQELMDKKDIALNDESFKLAISYLPLKDPIVVEVGTSVNESVQTMVKERIGCLLVVEKKQLRGIFTERDVLAKIAGIEQDLTRLTVDEFMTPDPITLHISDSLYSVLNLMNKGGYRHVAVVDENQHPVAVVSIKDIISYIVEFFPQEVLNLPPHPIRKGTRNQYGG